MSNVLFLQGSHRHTRSSISYLAPVIQRYTRESASMPSPTPILAVTREYTSDITAALTARCTSRGGGSRMRTRYSPVSAMHDGHHPVWRHWGHGADAGVMGKSCPQRTHGIDMPSDHSPRIYRPRSMASNVDLIDIHTLNVIAIQTACHRPLPLVVALTIVVIFLCSYA